MNELLSENKATMISNYLSNGIHLTLKRIPDALTWKSDMSIEMIMHSCLFSLYINTRHEFLFSWDSFILSVVMCSFVFLFVPWYLLEKPGMEVSQNQFSFWIFFSNAVCALALNFSIFLVIGRTGAVTIRVAGVLKDWILIALSTVIFPESVITGLNIIGYAIGNFFFYEFWKFWIIFQIYIKVIIFLQLYLVLSCITTWRSGKAVHLNLLKVSQKE